MRKRIIIALFILLSTISIGYAYYNLNLNAAGTNYQVPALATIKLGEKGMFPNGNIGFMSKGDKVYVGTNTASGNPMSFILLVNETYNTYQPQVNSSGIYSLDTSVPNVTGWFAMANEAYISDFQYFSRFPTALKQIITGAAGVYFYIPENYLTMNTELNMSTALAAVNGTISNNTKRILLSRNYDYLQKLYDLRNYNPALGYIYEENLHFGLLNPKSYYVSDNFTLESTSGTVYISSPVGGYGLSARDLMFSEEYFVTYVAYNSPTEMDVSMYSSAGVYGSKGTVTSSTVQSFKAALRLSAELDMSDVVFATGMGSGSTHSKVKNSSPDLSGSYSNIYTTTANYDKLKLRLLDNTGAHSITFNGIENRYNTSITKAAKSSTVYLDANAVAGSKGGDVNTVSALFFKNNELAYYIPIDTAHGSDKYVLDLSGLDVGQYKVALVNESYNESSMAPAESSALTAYQALEIVEPHKITYTKTPQSGASAGNDYEFSKNVNVGQAVGKITVNPQGVMPLTYTIEANGDNTYQNFEIDGLNSSGASSSTSLNMKIKSGAPDLVNGGLKAGNYKFCVTAVDANGDPVDTSGNPTEKVCTSFTVEKTNPTIAFNDPAQTKKSIAAAATAWNETATATPNTGTKITYSITGGDVSLISINPDTGAITYTGREKPCTRKSRPPASDPNPWTAPPSA